MVDRKFRTDFSKRQFMISEDYELYYYNDTSLKTVDMHSHDYYEFYFFIEGDVQMTINGTTYPLSSCDVMAIPPHTIHQMKVKDPSVPYRRVVLWLSERYFQDLMEQSEDYGYVVRRSLEENIYIHSLDLISFNHLRNKVFSAIQEQMNPGFGSHTQAVLLINDLLLSLNRAVYDSINKPKVSKEYPLYERILSYIDLHIDEKITLDDIAANFYISKYYASHVFTSTMGIPFHQYLTKQRLSLCRSAILKGMPPTTACLQYGFKDYSAFYRAYKKEYGVAPSETK